MKKVSYERRSYDSVDNGSPSWQIEAKQNSSSKGLTQKCRIKIIHRCLKIHS